MPFSFNFAALESAQPDKGRFDPPAKASESTLVGARCAVEDASTQETLSKAVCPRLYFALCVACEAS